LPARRFWRSSCRAARAVVGQFRSNRFGFGSINAPEFDFQEFSRLIQLREARQRTEILVMGLAHLLFPKIVKGEENYVYITVKL